MQESLESRRYVILARNLDRFEDLWKGKDWGVFTESPDDKIIFDMICAAFEVGVGPEIGLPFYEILHGKNLFAVSNVKELLKHPSRYANELELCLKQMREKKPKHIENLINRKWPAHMEKNLNAMELDFGLNSENLKARLREKDAVDFLTWVMKDLKWLKEKTASLFIRYLHDDGYEFRNYSLIDVALDSNIRRVISRFFLGFKNPWELGDIEKWESKSRYDYLIRVICRKISQIGKKAPLDVDFGLWSFGRELCPWQWECDKDAKCGNEFPEIAAACLAREVGTANKP